ncbi:MAG: hypothetical protein WKG01_39930, partial [Kofleriaceae bacterium]
MRALAFALVLAACGGSSSTTARKHPPDKRVAASTGEVQRGYAVWYGGGHHGGPTASGERYNKRAMTAA